MTTPRNNNQTIQDDINRLKSDLQNHDWKDTHLETILDESGFPIEAITSALDIGIAELGEVEPEVLQEKSNIRDMQSLRDGMRHKLPEITTSRGKYKPLSFLASQRGSYLVSQALFYALLNTDAIKKLGMTNELYMRWYRHLDTWKHMRKELFKYPTSHFEQGLETKRTLIEKEWNKRMIDNDGQHRYKVS